MKKKFLTAALYVSNRGTRKPYGNGKPLLTETPGPPNFPDPQAGFPIDRLALLRGSNCHFFGLYHYPGSNVNRTDRRLYNKHRINGSELDNEKSLV